MKGQSSAGPEEPDRRPIVNAESRELRFRSNGSSYQWLDVWTKRRLRSSATKTSSHVCEHAGERPSAPAPGGNSIVATDCSLMWASDATPALYRYWYLYMYWYATLAQKPPGASLCALRTIESARQIDHNRERRLPRDLRTQTT